MKTFYLLVCLSILSSCSSDDNEVTNIPNTNPALYNIRISDSVRLKNGNTLICEGDFGFWEVTSDGEIAWKYSKLDDALGFWRGYDYYFDDEAIINLGL